MSHIASQASQELVMGYQKGYFEALERQQRRIAHRAMRDTARRLARVDVQKRRWDEILEIRHRTGCWPDVTSTLTVIRLSD